jgi:hypothetical protein
MCGETFAIPSIEILIESEIKERSRRVGLYDGVRGNCAILCVVVYIERYPRACERLRPTR